MNILKSKLFQPYVLRFLLLGLFAAIAYLSLTPKHTLSAGNDKVGHFIAYCCLMGLYGLHNLIMRKTLFIPALFCAIYGVLLEMGQHLVPGRDFSEADMLANVLGVFLGYLINVLFLSRMIR